MLAYAFIYIHSVCVGGGGGSEGSDETACMRSYIQAVA